MPFALGKIVKVKVSENVKSSSSATKDVIFPLLQYLQPPNLSELVHSF